MDFNTTPLDSLHVLYEWHRSVDSKSVPYALRHLNTEITARKIFPAKVTIIVRNSKEWVFENEQAEEAEETEEAEGRTRKGMRLEHTLYNVMVPDLYGRAAEINCPTPRPSVFPDNKRSKRVKETTEYEEGEENFDKDIVALIKKGRKHYKTMNGEAIRQVSRELAYATRYNGLYVIMLSVVDSSLHTDPHAVCVVFDIKNHRIVVIDSIDMFRDWPPFRFPITTFITHVCRAAGMDSTAYPIIMTRPNEGFQETLTQWVEENAPDYVEVVDSVCMVMAAWAAYLCITNETSDWDAIQDEIYAKAEALGYPNVLPLVAEFATEFLTAWQCAHIMSRIQVEQWGALLDMKSEVDALINHQRMLLIANQIVPGLQQAKLAYKGAFLLYAVKESFPIYFTHLNDCRYIPEEQLLEVARISGFVAVERLDDIIEHVTRVGANVSVYSFYVDSHSEPTEDLTRDPYVFRGRPYKLRSKVLARRFPGYPPMLPYLANKSKVVNMRDVQRGLFESLCDVDAFHPKLTLAFSELSCYIDIVFPPTVCNVLLTLLGLLGMKP